MAATQAESSVTQGGPSYYGVVKSYNERRGFGFLACEETALSFGRDVYLSKDEASVLLQEPAVGSAAAAASAAAPADDEKKQSFPIKEGDFVQFEVQLSREGHPQAVRARRVRRLRGKILRPPTRGGGEGAILVQGDVKAGEASAAAPPPPGPPDPDVERLIGTEVRVRQADCGQLQLVASDEVVFCCIAAADAADGGGLPVLEAQLVELVRTSRASGSILGCFTLELPRALDPQTGSEGETAQPAVVPPPAVLDGHALTDRVVLAGLPSDLGAAELKKLLSKLGATDAVVTWAEGDQLREACGFASVSFAGPIEIARVLCRAAHTINDQGSTQLARLGPRRGDGEVVALPALPTPIVSPGEPGALLVQWTQVTLAAGYLVELRPMESGSPSSSAAWITVGVGSGRLEGTADDLPADLLGPQCSACRVNSLSRDTAYEARVCYFAACGCRSQVSSTSAPCTVVGPPLPAAAAPPRPALQAEPVASPDPSAAVTSAPSLPETAAWAPPPEPAPPPPPALPRPPDYGLADTMESGTAGPASVPLGPLQLPPVPHALAASSAMLPPPSCQPGMPGWRCQHGQVCPAPAAPELVPYEEAGRSLCVQWPTVVHAVAYTIELLEEGTATAERFTRTVPEVMPEALVELRVGNLNAGAYAACVRCVAPCGCESAPSSWSFLPPLWPSPTSAPPFSWQPEVLALSGADPSFVNPCQVPPHLPAYLPTQLLSTNPSTSVAAGGSPAPTAGPSPPAGLPPPPPPPAGPPGWAQGAAAAARQGEAATVGTADTGGDSSATAAVAAAAAVAVISDGALVLD